MRDIIACLQDEDDRVKTAPGVYAREEQPRLDQ